VTRKKFLVITAVVVVVIGGLAAGLLLSRHGNSRPHQLSAGAAPTPRSFPPGVQSALRLLLSAKGQTALTPELRSVLPSANRRLFPAGSTFTPIAGTWHQAGAYANVTGTLHEPAKSPMRAEIGFADRRGRWLVTFEGAL